MPQITHKTRMTATPVTVFVMLVLSLINSGCDPVKRVQQTVLLKVSTLDATAGGDDHPLSLSIREYHQRTAKDEELARFNPKREQQLYPWTPDKKLDDSGHTSITYGVTAIEGGERKNPAKSRYPLTDRTFRVRVRSRGGEVDEVLLQMRKGETAKGQRYQITVESISKAKYVKPK